MNGRKKNQIRSKNGVVVENYETNEEKKRIGGLAKRSNGWPNRVEKVMEREVLVYRACQGYDIEGGRNSGLILIGGPYT